MTIESDQYITLSGQSTGIFKDRGSKFIAIANPVFNEEEIKAVLDRIKNEYYDARHHCYAWVLDQDRVRYRLNDDGEPSGSAARPIHGQILSKQLTNTLIIVVRYFGGTKLGVPGLINAYKTASSEAIEAGSPEIRTIFRRFRITYPYEQMNAVMKIVKDKDVKIVGTTFEMQCLVIADVRLRDEELVFEIFHEKCPDAELTVLELLY